MSTQRMIIKRWPSHVRDRHASNITIYGWSTRRHGGGAATVLVVSAPDDAPCPTGEEADSAPPPSSFHPVSRRSGFLDLIGPLHVDDTDPREPVYGLRVSQKHANSRGGVHGGVLTTLADVALGYGSLAAHGEFLALVTASLTIDYTGSAAVGDWLEARTNLKRMGSRLAFASCEITSKDRTVASCSGVFSVPPAKSAD